MKHDNKVHFYFSNKKTTTKEAFLNDLVKNIREDKNIGYAGYSKKKYLIEELARRYDIRSIKTHTPLPEKKKIQVKDVVYSAVGICEKEVSFPQPVSVFIFPWLQKGIDKSFGGVNGFTPFGNTFMLFVSPEFSERSLRETVAHELNHALFFHYHSSEQTLLDSLVSEGEAEHFREQTVGGSIAPWAKALTKKEARKMLKKMGPLLREKGHYEEVFWKGRKYKKWSGYSIGYHIIKSFLKKYPALSWDEILKLDPVDIFNKSDFGEEKKGSDNQRFRRPSRK